MFTVVGGLGLMTYYFASGQPEGKDAGVPHYWDSASFRLPLVICVVAVIGIAIMSFVSHPRSGHIRGTIIGSMVLAAAVVAGKALWPEHVVLISFVHGLVVGFVAVVAFAVLIIGGRFGKKHDCLG
jgi:hypothetical protein